MGTGCKPEGPDIPLIKFDKSDWTSLLGRFKKKELNLPPGDAPAGSPQEVLSDKEQAKEREEKVQGQADAFGEAGEKFLRTPDLRAK